MKEILEELVSIRNDCESEGRRLSDELGLGVATPPLSAFGMCHNYATTALELLSWYERIWESLPPPTAGGMEERRQRIVGVTKSLFVFALSSIEFNLRESCKAHPHVLALPGRRQYLDRMIGKSCAVGLVKMDTKMRWDAIVSLRNTLVHNNGIADESLTVEFPSGAKVVLENGQMAIAKLSLFAQLTHWVVQEHSRWCVAFVKRSRSSE
jgi:hypothetical protein